MAKTFLVITLELEQLARNWGDDKVSEATAGDIQKLRQDLLAACVEWQIQAPCNHSPMPVAVGINRRIYCEHCSKLLEEVKI